MRFDEMEREVKLSGSSIASYQLEYILSCLVG